jgi:hypothetical protein
VDGAARRCKTQEQDAATPWHTLLDFLHHHSGTSDWCCRRGLLASRLVRSRHVQASDWAPRPTYSRGGMHFLQDHLDVRWCGSPVGIRADRSSDQRMGVPMPVCLSWAREQDLQDLQDHEGRAGSCDRVTWAGGEQRDHVMYHSLSNSTRHPERKSMSAHTCRSHLVSRIDHRPRSRDKGMEE